jgi:hypothetical protein
MTIFSTNQLYQQCFFFNIYHQRNLQSRSHIKELNKDQEKILTFYACIKLCKKF